MLCHSHEVRVPKIIIRRDRSGQSRILGTTWRFASLRPDDRFPLLAESIAGGHVELTAGDKHEPENVRFRCSRAFALAVFMHFMLDMSSQRLHLDVFLRALHRTIPTAADDTPVRPLPFKLLLEADSSLRFSSEVTEDRDRDRTRHGSDENRDGWIALTHCLERRSTECQ